MFKQWGSQPRCFCFVSFLTLNNTTLIKALVDFATGRLEKVSQTNRRTLLSNGVTVPNELVKIALALKRETLNSPDISAHIIDRRVEQLTTNLTDLKSKLDDLTEKVNQIVWYDEPQQDSCCQSVEQEDTDYDEGLNFLHGLNPEYFICSNGVGDPWRIMWGGYEGANDFPTAKEAFDAWVWWYVKHCAG
jgi:hypothetical protein